MALLNSCVFLSSSWIRLVQLTPLVASPPFQKVWSVAYLTVHMNIVMAAHSLLSLLSALARFTQQSYSAAAIKSACLRNSHAEGPRGSLSMGWAIGCPLRCAPQKVEAFVLAMGIMMPLVYYTLVYPERAHKQSVSRYKHRNTLCHLPSLFLPPLLLYFRDLESVTECYRDVWSVYNLVCIEY